MSPEEPGEGAEEPYRPVDIVIEDERWLDVGLEDLANRAVGATAAYLGLHGVEVVVLGCDDQRIAGLNDHFRGKPTPTNVLSWPSVSPAPRADGASPAPPAVPELGDIAISYDTCSREAKDHDKPMADHVVHLLVHATLHLIGYDHEIDADAETMEQAERSVLAGLGIPDPYR
ncbi:rRNA maturation RNase YbeY [uncultured Paracoccus sp.]|uniref:rRNA maturation RNase YbeY n=1 Tax=uncultured Paracoccus sp. TaxID=189685 RepID=UPI00262A21E5|nr:rRNA maturation RNase YbeY [uncultured Paracoccus sp.]